ncbi:hypothetical protein SAMN04487866_12616 [Thermoactinomyces sp. DSM 45891]|uniref:hypothetical protein n=1 Tax=Thermoactinomyces sp. DSM 45891 TaxID=1761907 RepID=UPI0009173F80|nr:hypothetical protein [Thermoactinomyces sp. DSM 45891]SFX79349.1 hypothetical protein SAMN04487866_12616 [Thermoactinomyces sp. DSM 45891]
MMNLFSEIGVRYGGLKDGEEAIGIFEDGAVYLQMYEGSLYCETIDDVEEGEKMASEQEIDKVIRLKEYMYQN